MTKSLDVRVVINGRVVSLNAWDAMLVVDEGPGTLPPDLTREEGIWLSIARWARAHGRYPEAFRQGTVH